MALVCLLQLKCCSFVTMAVQLVLLSLLFCTVQATHRRFDVVTTPWSACSHINVSSCYRTREAWCVMRSSDNVTAPWYYCTDRHLSRPSTLEVCEPGSCVQNCIVSEWSAWNVCDCNIGLFKKRSREIISPPRNGGQECPLLVEFSLCSCALNLPWDSQPRRYTWKVGRWSQCTALNHNGSQCGPATGLMSRTVECVDLGGTVVEPEHCLQEPVYTSIHPPSKEALCEAPCPCILGEWEDWKTHCAPHCQPGQLIRTRPILQYPTLGQTCESTEEMRTCLSTDMTCLTYTWETSDWSPCMFQTGATCGDGHKTRFVYCIEARNGNMVNVDHVMCQHLSTPKPSHLEVCQTICPQACRVGEWSDWTECPRSSNQTYSNRTRKIILLPLGEEACPHVLELRPCPVLHPVYWHTEPFVDCFLLPSSGPNCGLGQQNRDVTCVTPEGNMLNDYECRDLPRPINAISCHIPCQNECVISNWSDWSPCSETCDGRIGNQTRRRHFIAQGYNCPYTSNDLVQTQSCSDQRECVFTRYYIQTHPWGGCSPSESSLRSSGDEHSVENGESGHSSGCGGSGVRNRTSDCMKGDEVISVSDCPIKFQSIEVESCELPCSRDYVYGEWSDFSQCSCYNRMKTRSRRLLQFQLPQVSDSDVDEYGFQSESVHCTRVCSGDERRVDWHGRWSNCILYRGVLSQRFSCGLGYQSIKSLECVEIDTDLTVSNSRCVDHGIPKPTARRCNLTCPDNCIVTEWSDFNMCTYGGNRSRHRDIILPRGCTSVNHCCPQLSNIVKTQSISCPSFSNQCYSYYHSMWSQCMLDSPFKTCGNGRQYRTVACLNICRNNEVVDTSFCSMTGAVAVKENQPCNIPCQRNCIHSEWGVWTQCSVSCGKGYCTRNRTIMRIPDAGGRPCGHLMETDICFNEPCPFIEIMPSPYGECVLHNSTSICGEGVRTRHPICYVNRELQHISMCLDLGSSVPFALNESCSSPCPGECVLSEWGGWNRCPSPGSRHHRRRKILRKGNEECMEMQQESRMCNPQSSPYQWINESWGDCIITPPTSEANEGSTYGHYCGMGVRSRIVQCFNNSRLVPNEFCSEMEEPLSSENCSIPCPIDCKVLQFSDWSECPGCVIDLQNQLYQRRSRVVLVDPMHGGEVCPDSMQEKPCIPFNCTSFQLINHTSFTVTDYTMGSQCGFALVIHLSSCQINTKFVPCSSDLIVDSYTELQCPPRPQCIFSEWSDWSECTALCHDLSVMFRYRSRRLNSYLFTEHCEAEQYEQIQCILQPDDVGSENGTELIPTTGGGLEPNQSTINCISFSWQVSEWNGDERTVYCESNTGIRVENSACPQSLIPHSRNETCEEITCPSHATCDDSQGICVATCDALFEEVQGICLPREGCAGDEHCIFLNMECSGDRCVCSEGYKLIEGDDRCIPTATTTISVPSTSDVSQSDVTMSDVTMETSDKQQPTISTSEETDTTVTENMTLTEEDTTAGGIGILPIILIATLPLLLIIVLVAVLIVITCRCSRTLEQKQQDHEVKRRRIKASISSPSPVPQTTEELMLRVHHADSESDGVANMERGDYLNRYGWAGRTFTVGSQMSIDTVDEPFDQQYPQNSVVMHPIPTAVPIPPIFNRGPEVRTSRGPPVPLSNQRPCLSEFPDGGMTTDMTYTTDDDTIGTTSVPASSAGSPNIPRRCHYYNGREQDYPQHNAIDNSYVAMHRRSPIYASLKDRQERSHDRYRGRSATPPESSGHYSREFIHHGERDRRIAVGLDSSMLRAVNQLDDSHTPTSVRSSHKNSSQRRRHGRRRRSHSGGRSHTRSPTHRYNQYYFHHSDGRVHNDHYSRGRYYSSGGYHNDGSDHDHYSTSDAEYPTHSEPMSPTDSIPEEDYHSNTIPRSGPRVHFSDYQHHNHHHRHGNGYEPNHRHHRYRDYYPGDGDHQESPSHHDHTPKWYNDKHYEVGQHSKSSRSFPREERGYHSDHLQQYDPQHYQSFNESGHQRYSSPPRHRSHPHHRPHQHCHQQDMSPPTSPVDPSPHVPPHGCSNNSESRHDNYDYPSNYQPQAIQKLKEEASRKESPYASPRPVNSLGNSPRNSEGSSDHVGRVSSSYNYPRICNDNQVASRLPQSTPLANPNTASDNYVHLSPKNLPPSSSPRNSRHITVTPQPNNLSAHQTSSVHPIPRTDMTIQIPFLNHVDGTIPHDSPLSSKRHPPSPLVIQTSAGSPRSSGDSQELVTRANATTTQYLSAQQ